MSSASAVDKLRLAAAAAKKANTNNDTSSKTRTAPHK